MFNPTFTVNTEASMNNEDLDIDKDSLMEAFLVDELSSFNEAQLEAFNESDIKIALVEAGKMRRNTIHRIGQKDDLARRETLAAMEIARQKKDPLWEKLRINRVKERELLGKIRDKYGNKATRLAKTAQKDYIKNRMPNQHELFGTSPR